jgi:hypothetical protein
MRYEIASNISLNAGLRTARVASQSFYMMNKDGHILNPHFDLYAVCRGVVCGSQAPTPNIPTNNKNALFFLDYIDRTNNVLTIGVALRGTFSVTGGHMGVAGKTHDATCPNGSGSNTACRWTY